MPDSMPVWHHGSEMTDHVVTVPWTIGRSWTRCADGHSFDHRTKDGDKISPN